MKKKINLKEKSDRLYNLSLFFEYTSIVFIIGIFVCVIFAFIESQCFLRFMISGAICGMAMMVCRAISYQCFTKAGTCMWQKISEKCKGFKESVPSNDGNG